MDLSGNFNKDCTTAEGSKLIGERCLPNLDSPKMSYEHWHRYLYATQFVKDKVVLDIICGEGDGSYLFSHYAKKVIGVDISPDIIRYANSKYVNSNLDFKVGSVGNIPVDGEAIFDVIVSFKTIEYLSEAEQSGFLKETKRLLKSDGLFIASIPNKLIYSNLLNHKNEFHIKVFYVDEFKELLGNYFKNTKLLGQKIYPVSYIWNSDSHESRLIEYRLGYSENGFRPSDESKSILYGIAICSDSEIGNTNSSILIDLSEKIFKQKDAHIFDLESIVREKKVEVESLRNEQRERTTYIFNLEGVVKEKEATLNHIYNSHGWKTLLVYYRLREKIFPINSRRRKVAKFVWNWIWDVFENKKLKAKGISNLKRESRKKMYLALIIKVFEILSQQGLKTLLNKINYELRRKSQFKQYLLTLKKLEESDDIKKNKAKAFQYKPKISIILPVYNTGNKKWLKLCIKSVTDQIYDNWELCIVDGGSTIPHIKEILKEYAGKDNRIKINFLLENKGIARNSNGALALATGEFIGFLDHDDELEPSALYEVVKLLNEDQGIDFIYSDEDKIFPRGERAEPHFKPDWSPDTLRSHNYIAHFAVIRKKVIDEVGGFREGYEGSQDHDLFLRIVEKTQRIAHIPKVLYHWRAHEASAGGNPGAKMYAYDSAKRALKDHIQRIGLKGEVEDGPFLGTYRIRYHIDSSPWVSIIIPNKDKVDVLERCINSILQRSSYKNYKIFIVDNQSRQEKTYRYYQGFRDKAQVKILRYDKPFNFSAINNYAVSQIDSEYIIFLNNDTEIISSCWIEAMLEFAQRRDVGAVGALLYYPNETIQHAGVIIGVGGVGGHSHNCLPRNTLGYMGRAKIIQNLSAVTGACLMTKREIFEEVGGFDEGYSHAFNDVDLCLKIRERGYLIVYTPYAELYHHESLSRGHENTPEKRARFKKEIKRFQEKWKNVLADGDPYYNPNLTLDKEDFSIRA